MIYSISFIIIILFSNIYSSCVIFTHHYHSNCILARSTDQGYKQCLRCYINEIISNIKLNKSCSPIPDNHCVDLHFNTTILFKNFSLQYNNLINKLFDRTDEINSKRQNILYIHIEYDTLDILSLDTFRAFDEIENRNYFGLSFELKNRDHRLKLLLNKDIQNMTLWRLQIIIYCGLNGLYQYNYVSYLKEPLVESIQCEIPIKIFNNISTTTQKNYQYKYVLIFSLIAGGSLILCFILFCCLYILCKRNIDKNNQQRDSLASSLTDSLLSDNSVIS